MKLANTKLEPTFVCFFFVKLLFSTTTKQHRVLLAMDRVTRSLKVSFAIALSLLKNEDKLWKLTSALLIVPLTSQAFARLSEVKV
jgi:hypothetical protein